MLARAAEVTQTADPGQAAEALFVDAAFNAFQAEAQGKALVTFRVDGARGPTSLTLAGRDGIWSNPVTGAFGGVAAQGADPAGVAAVTAAATDWLRGQPQARQASLRLPPDCFPDPNAAALENALFRAGWRLDQADVDQWLPVVPGEAFARTLGETKQKELRRLARSGAAFRTLPPEEVQRAYDVIARNRTARGFPMTMSWAQVAALRDAFPDRVAFHLVEREGVGLAGAIVLRVTGAFLYVFYWGEDPDVRRESPVMLLAQGLAQVADEAGAAILDIGVSTDRSEPNPGLMAFKESLGCRTAGKRTYVLDLAVEANR
jgi:hypothetical protein